MENDLMEYGQGAKREIEVEPAPSFGDASPGRTSQTGYIIDNQIFHQK